MLRSDNKINGVFGLFAIDGDMQLRHMGLVLVGLVGDKQSNTCRNAMRIKGERGGGKSTILHQQKHPASAPT